MRRDAWHNHPTSRCQPSEPQVIEKSNFARAANFFFISLLLFCTTTAWNFQRLHMPRLGVRPPSLLAHNCIPQGWVLWIWTSQVSKSGLLASVRVLLPVQMKMHLLKLWWASTGAAVKIDLISSYAFCLGVLETHWLSFSIRSQTGLVLSAK